MLKRLIQISCFFLFAVVLGVVWFAWYASGPLLMPMNLDAPSSEVQELLAQKEGGKYLVFQSIQAVSKDGVEVEGLLVNTPDNCQFSPTQNRVRDTLKLRGKLPHLERKEELVVICTSWDDGQESALPMAESLAGAGYTCLIWNARGKDNARQYCSYGLVEYADVSALLDEIEKKQGNLPPVAVVGRGFGSAVLFKAAAHDARIRCVVSIDGFPSLKTIAMRDMEMSLGSPLSFIGYWLLDAGVEMRAGYTTFDVAPVDDALKLDYPVMVVCTDEYFFSTLEDNVAIYDSLKNEKKSLVEAIHEGEDFQAKEKIFTRIVEGKKGQKFEKNYKVKLYSGDDELQAGIAEWIYENTRMPMPKVLNNDSVSFFYQ